MILKGKIMRQSKCSYYLVFLREGFGFFLMIFNYILCMAFGIDGWWSIVSTNIIKKGENKPIFPHNMGGDPHLWLKGHLLISCFISRIGPPVHLT